MIMSTIVYALCVAGLLGLFALVAERVCAELRLPRRGAWAIALTASLALPTYSMLDTPSESGAGFSLLPFVIELVPAVLPEGVRPTGDDAGDARWPGWLTSTTLDDVLLWLWIGSSGLMLLGLALAALGLRAAMGRCETRTIDGADVVLSERLGPAVFGFVRPRIVLPRWLADGNRTLRTLVLTHEREHVAARDQLLLLAGLALAAAMPWNVAVWWQLRRLRAAVELDCDARVVRGGADAASYSEALLTVRLGGVSVPLGAVALTEPVSYLERRIRTMLEESKTLSLTGVGARAVLALSLLGLAMMVTAPQAQQSTGTQEQSAETRSGSTKAVPAMRESVYRLLSQAQDCAEVEDFGCTRERMDQVAQIADLNPYETSQLWYFRAFVEYSSGDLPRAIAAYENVLRVPDLIPALRTNTLIFLSQLYSNVGQHQEAIDAFDEWLTLTPAPSPDVYMVRANAEYQLGRFDDALESVERVISDAEEPSEHAYTMRLAIQMNQDDQEGAIETLEILNANWPSPERARQLAGLREAD